MYHGINYLFRVSQTVNCVPSHCVNFDKNHRTDGMTAMPYKLIKFTLKIKAISLSL